MADAAPGRTSEPTLLERLGLHRPELRAWAMYDWANSAFWATIILIFPFYFVRVAPPGICRRWPNEHYAWATTVAMVIMVALSPVLGAIADHAGVKKKMLAAFLRLRRPRHRVPVLRGPRRLAAGHAPCSCSPASASTRLSSSTSRCCPTSPGEDEMDRVSAAGYALGYLGSRPAPGLNLLWIS